ncbi:radical SAM/SPASM domain-containing protein [Anoxybacillus geothermalis]|jgi:radical SAM protein with 4Fe4S-binding SPASM domain|uniref:Putative Heme biosynthesis protein n=2 Tax=Geobacillus TaxID=129337 RepID=A4IU27_GEOTN|nr:MULTISPECIES: radical SAM/SPASM domain-containing protein [Geobacillus]MED4877744.1 radical SAM/SPASM domain-containing protein [Anoxybacillus geothermalis]ABO68831.1 Putative Heme biosynthesis protein [Geobacillus thermodenitrificans NG80-2]MED4923063.1 radical SAM/SPASM domain-containing protein [Anoxybacillus geothermalis]NNV00842.1 radical SAM/SPASM domain-containing protein [Geobacillus sp. DSP4a]OPX01907.1 radical SAM/SPASM domain-containing protein [Geobacillus sp. LEMMY01]
MSQNLESLIPYIEKIKKMKFREDLGLLFESNTGIIHRVDGDIGVLILSLIRQNHDINYIKNYILQEYDVQEEELIDDIFVFISNICEHKEKVWEWDIEKKHNKLLEFPLRIEIEVTSLCNWNCGFCYNVWKIDPNLSDEDVQKKIKMLPQKHLPKETVFKILDECNENGCFIVRYSGGETLLHPDIEEILEYGGSLGLYQVVFTNGHFITPERAERFKKYNVGTVLISLHGDKRLHNLLTGHKMAYQKAVSAIETLVKTGIEVVVELTLVKENFNSAIDVMKDAYNRGARYFSVMRYVPTGKNDDKYGVPIENMLPLMKQIDELQKQYDDLVIAWPCGQKMCTSIEDSPLSADDPTLPLRKRQLSGHCEAGLVWGSISFNGKLRHCPHSNVYFGDVTTDGIKSIWNKMTKKVSEVLTPRNTCMGCSELYSCRGGCHLPYFFEPSSSAKSQCSV